MAFQIVGETCKTNKKYRFSRKSVSFKLNNTPQHFTNPETWIKDGIKEIVSFIVKDVDSEDKVGFTFTSDNFHKEGYLPFKNARDVTFEEVWNLLASIYQSNSSGFDTDTFRMTMTHIKPYRGTGRVRNYNTFEEECNRRQGIIAINNKDNLCLLRSLVVAIAYALKLPYSKQIRRNVGKRQDHEVETLMKNSGICIPEGGAGIEEITQLQCYLKDYKITVYTYGSKGRDVLFEGPDAPNKINLLYYKNHFSVIMNLSAAFCCRYYCEACHLPYNNKNGHRCSERCPCCQQSPPCEKIKKEVLCEDCNRKFRGIDCFNKHKAGDSSKGNSICALVKLCTKCLKTVKANRVHECGEIFCKICNRHRPSNHQCFMQQNRRTPNTDNILFIFYDLETRQDKILKDGRREHTPNLCVFQHRCNKCIEEQKLYFCQKCGHRQVIYKTDIIPSFMKHILAIRKKFKNVIILAHNGQAFDHQFLLKYILQSTVLKLDLIMRGSKIVMMNIDNIKFIDSLNYFPMALSTLPKAFELGPELKKGYFPHSFNIEGNENYVGHLPNINYYDPDRLKDDERLELLEWHEKHKHDIFNMQQDLIEYCISDVDILAKACLKFRKMFLEKCNVCPFTEAVTIASACNLVYRRNFLKPETIGIIPRLGYRYKNNQSKIAIKWLLWLEHQRGISIQHAAKVDELVINGIKVDGYCAETEQIFAFHGCYYHGHTCITADRDKPMHEDPSDTLSQRYERTLASTSRLRHLGHEVIETWECEFRELMKTNNNIAEFTENHPLVALLPLNPRDAFYGGRTGNTKTYYKVNPGEKIHYIDICSLYPWICKTGVFPIAHPQIYVGRECPQNLNNVEGVIKCKILPPMDLYHPVLPAKMNNKLMFVLCRLCGETMNQNECMHDDSERALTGTWIIDEVRKAIVKGYTILEIFEIWSYEVDQYDKVKKTGGLFTEMMNQFIKIKHEATGFPSNCITQEEKEHYIEDVLNNEGVLLEFSKINKNGGLRSLAKLMLNSFWGKFGQRQNQPQTTIIRQCHELYAILNDPAKHVNNIHEVDEETLIVSWEYVEEAADPLSTVNVVVAAYVTTQARLKLYSYLEQLGNRVLYYDTDSVIYISRESDWDIPTGTLLGDMTNELDDFGPGSYIVAFASGGPKNYGYIVFSPKYHTYYTLCKVKGFCLNFDATKLINFYTMEAMVTEKQEAPIFITSLNIRRGENHSVVTKQETKVFRTCSEKRKFQGFNSVPYGYKKLKIIEEN